MPETQAGHDTIRWHFTSIHMEKYVQFLAFFSCISSVEIDRCPTLDSLSPTLQGVPILATLCLLMSLKYHRRCLTHNCYSVKDLIRIRLMIEGNYLSSKTVFVFIFSHSLGLPDITKRPSHGGLACTWLFGPHCGAQYSGGKHSVTNRQTEGTKSIISLLKSGGITVFHLGQIKAWKYSL